MNITIGIVTKNRASKLYRLLYSLQPQLKTNHNILILENGSNVVKKDKIKQLKIKRFKLIKKNFSNIPKARNILLNLAKERKSEVIIFIDDDCIPSSNWLKEYEQTLKENKNIQVLQGKIKSIPKNNVYAQTSQLLFNIWFEANKINTEITNKKQLICENKIIDTKNVAFRLKNIKKHKFNEQIKFFAADIDYASQLTKRGVTINYFKKATIFHEEKTTFITFIKHRLRLSSAYRKINIPLKHHFNSKSTKFKILYLWQNLDFFILTKIKVILALLTAYTISFLKTIPWFTSNSTV